MMDYTFDNIQIDFNQKSLDYESNMENLKDLRIFQIHRDFRTQKTQSISQNDQKIIKINYNRKEKSLEELSKKFLQLFSKTKESLISLDEITTKLCVERRRIYDIINILQSLKLVSKKEKTIYKWNGYDFISNTLLQIENYQPDNSEQWDQNENKKRKKNLELLSIGFVKTFMKYKNTVTLEEAAKYIQPENKDYLKIKTQIRRLYDIANVFKSLGLITKVHLNNGKPAFRWLGMNKLRSPQKNNFIFENQKLDYLYQRICQKTQNTYIQTVNQEMMSLVKRKTHIIVMDENFQTQKKQKSENQICVMDTVLKDTTNTQNKNQLDISEKSSFSSFKKIKRDINFEQGIIKVY